MSMRIRHGKPMTGDPMDHLFQVDVAHIELGCTYMPSADFFESENDYRVSLEMPGVVKKDVRVEIVDRIITIEGTKRNTDSEECPGPGMYFHLMTRVFGRFRRRFEIPGAFDANSVKAVLDNGVLTVTATKIHDKRRRTIVVTVEQE